jgi:NADH-quinone oxidoreductase subunit J
MILHLPLLLLILLSALAAVWLAKPVHAALCMALALALTAVLYLVLGAHFIGLVQFMVYVGAVAVLIVFALLMTRRGEEAGEISSRPRSWLIGLACALPATAALVKSALAGSPVKLSPSTNPEVSLTELGRMLFTDYAPAVLVVALVLTAVLIGAALFAREPQKDSIR